MAIRPITLANIPEDATSRLDGGFVAVIALTRGRADSHLLAVSRAPRVGWLGDRRPSFILDGSAAHSWKPARTARHSWPFLWSYTQDTADPVQLVDPDGTSVEVRPSRHDLRPDTATRLYLGNDAIMMLVAVSRDRTNRAFPFRLTADQPILSVTHLGSLDDVDLAIAFTDHDITSLHISDD